MTNVTAGPLGGYRLLPRHMRFGSPIALHLPYDERLLPPGLSSQGIRTFYFDERARGWKLLPRFAVDAETHTPSGRSSRRDEGVIHARCKVKMFYVVEHAA